MINDNIAQSDGLNQLNSPDINTVTQFWAGLHHDEEVVAEQLNFYLYLFLYQYYLGILSTIDNYNLALERYIQKQEERDKTLQIKDTALPTEIIDAGEERLADAVNDDDSHAFHDDLSTGKQKKAPPKKPNMVYYQLQRWLRIVLDIAPESACLDLFDEALMPINELDKRRNEQDKLKANFSTSLQEQAILILGMKDQKNDTKSDQELKQLVDKLTENLDEKARKIIEEKILKFCEQRIAVPKNKVESVLNLLNLLIQKGNQDQFWDLCLVNSVILADREQHPLAKELQWRKLLDMEKFEHAIQAQLKTYWHDLLFVEQVVKISLMIDSFIIEPKLYLSVITAINQEDLKSVDDHLYVDVYVDRYNPSRKVFISALTRIYLQQYRQLNTTLESPRQLDDSGVSDSFLSSLKLLKSHYPRSKSIKSWFVRVKSYLMFVKGIPGLLAYYLTNSGSSYSLKDEKFVQLFAPSKWASANTAIDYSQALENIEDTYVTPTRLLNPPAWSRVLSLLNVTHIDKNKQKQVLDSLILDLNAIITDGFLDDNEKLLVEWAIYLLDKPTPMMPYSVRKRLFAIGQRLVALANGVPIFIKDYDNPDKKSKMPASLSANARLEMYRDCLELAVSQRNHETMRVYLYGFERWLCQVKNTAPIPYDEEFHLDKHSINHTVNASLVMFEHYHQVYDDLLRLETETNNEDYRFMRLILMMGFRLGMRRDEIVSLKMDDYLYSEHTPMLITQESELRTLKTSNAQRYFRLADHMPDEEWKALNAHYYAIQSKNKTLKRRQIKHFFPQQQAFEKIINDDRYFSPLMALIRDRTQDKHIKFHQLRHAKASFEFLAAFEAQFDLQIGKLFFKDYPKTLLWLNEAKERFNQSLTSKTHYNKAPFWIHEIMGHGAMTMTLGHYVHLMDLVVAAFEHKQAQEQMTLAWLTSLGLINKNRYYRYPEQLLSLVLEVETANKQSLNKAFEDDAFKDLASQHHEPVDRVLPQTSNISSKSPLIEVHLLEYPAYAMYQLFLNRDDSEQLALLKNKLNLTTEQLSGYLEQATRYPKLVFQDVAKNQKQQLLLTLQSIETYYGINLKEANATLPNQLSHDLDLFEKRLKVRTKEENGNQWVNQYELRCFTQEDAQQLVAMIESLGYHPAIVVFYPNTNEQKTTEVKKHWQQALKIEHIEMRHEVLNNKYGRVHISATVKGKKIQAFYLALATVRFWCRKTTYNKSV